MLSLRTAFSATTDFEFLHPFTKAKIKKNNPISIAPARTGLILKVTLQILIYAKVFCGIGINVSVHALILWTCERIWTKAAGLSYDIVLVCPLISIVILWGVVKFTNQAASVPTVLDLVFLVLI
jgi:hypothetical protein